MSRREEKKRPSISFFSKADRFSGESSVSGFAGNTLELHLGVSEWLSKKISLRQYFLLLCSFYRTVYFTLC